MTTGSTGLVEPVDARSIAAATSVAVATTGGTKIAITASMPGSASSGGSTASYVAAVAEPRTSTGLAKLASAGAAAASCRTVSFASAGSVSEAASHASA